MLKTVILMLMGLFELNFPETFEYKYLSTMKNGEKWCEHDEKEKIRDKCDL